MSNKNFLFSPKYDFELVEKNFEEKIEIFFQTSFVIMPPPNITGNLHLGHSLNLVLQDYYVRRSFIDIKEKPIYLISGFDHAGIATQSKIDSLKISHLQNSKEKENFIFETWLPQLKENFENQWKKLGLLLDYQQNNFTLSLANQKKVKSYFISLYNDNLIYRDKKIVNWDPWLKTVVSNIETESKFAESQLYYLKYYISNSKDYLLVATSRPETIFADVALFVNPQDKRYQKYIGKQAEHFFSKKNIPILADESIIEEFGSGVFKCTPGHDLKDYKIGEKHNLPIISCCDEKGLFNNLAGKWMGKEPQKIRAELIEDLRKQNICLKIEKYQTTINYSQKSGAIIEPLLSTQWFLDLPLMMRKIEAKTPKFLEKIDILPRKFSIILQNWKEKTEQWCISRQLWWGHRIPAWYHKKTQKIYVNEDPPVDGENWNQERDVLDTWFSSCLWPLLVFSQEKFSSALSLTTAYDILFFWVLKMIIFCFYFANKSPFKKLFIHGLIRDNRGQKMSKSLGNGIEPDIIIKKYGADSLRLFLLSNNIWGSDINFQEEKIKFSWNFLQKIWSIANLIFKNIPFEELRKENNSKELEEKLQQEKNQQLKILNFWIWEKFHELKQKYSINKNETNFLSQELINFTWEKLSNNYLELIKVFSLNSRNVGTLLFIYQQLLILLYPIAPFITEYIYQKITKKNIPKTKIEILGRNNIVSNKTWQIDCLLSMIKNIRNFQKSNSKASYKFYLELMPEWESKLDSSFDFNFFLEPLTKCEVLIFSKDTERKNFSFIDLQPFGVLWYHRKQTIDELKKKLEFYEKEYERSKKILRNTNFLKKAPPWLVAEEQKKLIYHRKQKIETEEKLKK